MNKIVRHWAAKEDSNFLQTGGHRAPDKLFEHILERDRNAEFVQHACKNAIGNQFTVDQYSIAIEDYQRKSTRIHRLTGNWNRLKIGQRSKSIRPSLA